MKILIAGDFCPMYRVAKLIADDKHFKFEQEQWIKTNSRGYLFAQEPYQGRYLSALYFRNLLPSFINKKEMLEIMNYINCEAHLDR